MINIPDLPFPNLKRHWQDQGNDMAPAAGTKGKAKVSCLTDNYMLNADFSVEKMEQGQGFVTIISSISSRPANLHSRCLLQKLI